MMKKLIISFTCIFSLTIHYSCFVFSQYYVRDGATGNNDGSDWENAFTYLPNHIGANDYAYTDLERGATYYIASGDYTDVTFYFADDTAGSQYITIKKATVQEHGTDVGWQDSYENGQAIFGPFIVGTSYYIFDGATGGGPGAWDTGFGIKVMFDDLSYPDRIRLIDIRGENWWTPPMPRFLKFQHLELQHRGIDNEQADDGLYSGSSTDSTMHDEDLKNSGPQNVTISHCYFHDFGRNPLLVSRGRYWLVEKNLFARNSSSAAIHSEGWQDFYSNDMVVRNNIWNDIEGTAVIAFKHNSAYSNSNWQIYGNIFYQTFENPYDRTGVGDGIFALTAGGYEANTISFHDNGTNPDQIEDSEGGFNFISHSSEAIIEGEKIMVKGSLSNDGIYKVVSKTESVITLSVEDSLVDETAGADIEIGTGYAYNFSVHNNDIVGVTGLNIGFSNYGLTMDIYAYNNIWYSNEGHQIGLTDLESHDYNWFNDNYRIDPDVNLSTVAAATEDNSILGTGDPFINWHNLNFNLHAPIPGMTLDSEYAVDMYGNVRGADGVWDVGAIEYDTNTSGINISTLKDASFYLYPNPANEYCRIEVNAPSVENFSVLLYDLQGRMIYKSQNYVGDNTVVIPTGSFSCGIYIVKSILNDQTLNKKLLIKR